jgi:hypothetical protein
LGKLKNQNQGQNPLPVFQSNATVGNPQIVASNSDKKSRLQVERVKASLRPLNGGSYAVF